MTSRTAVLVVGGSLNGLTTALLLAHHGVDCIVVERHPNTTVQYKFRGISPRSMEIYRGLGIQDEIRAHLTGDQKAGDIGHAKNLSDPNVQWMGEPWADTAQLSAATAETCDQDHLGAHSAGSCRAPRRRHPVQHRTRCIRAGHIGRQVPGSAPRDRN